MGSSCIHFKSRTVSMLDSATEVFLRLLVDEIDREPAPPDWLKEAREDWQITATGGFGFGVIPALDRYLTDEDRQQQVVLLAERARARLAAMGDPIPAAVLNALGSGPPGSDFEREVPAAVFLDSIDRFIDLLRPAR